MNADEIDAGWNLSSVFLYLGDRKLLLPVLGEGWDEGPPEIPFWLQSGDSEVHHQSIFSPRPLVLCKVDSDITRKLR